MKDLPLHRRPSHNRKKYNDFIDFTQRMFWLWFIMLFLGGGILEKYLFFSPHIRNTVVETEFDFFAIIVNLIYISIICVYALFKSNWQIMYITQQITSLMFGIAFGIIICQYFNKFTTTASSYY